MKNNRKVLLSVCLILMIGFCSFLIFKVNESQAVLVSSSSHLLVTITNDKPDSLQQQKQPIKTDDTMDEDSDVNEKENQQKTLSHKIKLEISQKVQENEYYCVPAVLQMVLDFNGIQVSQTTLAHEMLTSPETGTEYVDLARVANKYLFKNENPSANEAGYRVQTLNIGSMSLNEKQTLEQRIVTNISTNDPTFVAIDNKAMYGNVNRGNHMVLIVGYNLKPNTDEVESYIFIDPSYVVQDDVHGGLKVVSKEGLYKAIYENEEPAYVY